MEKLDVRNTYVFEIIDKRNVIVVSYGDYEGLVLLGAFNTVNNVEVDRTELEALEGFDLVNKYDGVNDFAKLKAIIPNDAEGFVIRFKSGMRMKIKGEEYVRLHRILTNISTTSIWDVLRSGGNFAELLDRVPDEFDGWVRETIRGLNEDFSRIKEDHLKIFARLEEESLSRKDFAIRTKEYAYPSILFSMLDGRDYEKYIWDLVKPDFAKALNNNSLFLKRYLEM
jgi:RNA ligase